MRIGFNTLYNLSENRLNRVKSALLDANTRVVTGKKINALSDDPVTVAPVLNLKSSILSVEQYKTNIASGRQWLEGAESALSNVIEQITEAKTSAIAMINGIITTENFQSGAEAIDGILNHVLTLANTQVNSRYIFSGTKTNIPSFTVDDPDNISKVLYNGGADDFYIKMSESSKIGVGYCGDNVFQTPHIVVDETNNKIDFREDPAGGAVEYGAELTAVIPPGKYTPKELATTIETIMTDRSAAAGQPEVINVTENNAKVVVKNYSALSVPGTVQLTYSEASDSWAVTGDPGFTPPIAVQGLSNSSGEVNLDFTGSLTSDVKIVFDPPVTDGYTVSFDVTPSGGNAIKYSVNYNEGTKKFTILEDSSVPGLDNLQLLWSSGSNAATGIGVDLGFDISTDLTGLPDGTVHTSDEAEWGIFRTLIELRNYIDEKDTDGINRSITRLSADFDYIGSVLSEIGIKENRLDVRDNIISGLNISYESTKMQLEDADMVHEITTLLQKEFAYNAAMNSTAKVIRMSLLDYL